MLNWRSSLIRLTQSGFEPATMAEDMLEGLSEIF